MAKAIKTNKTPKTPKAPRKPKATKPAELVYPPVEEVVNPGVIEPVADVTDNLKPPSLWQSVKALFGF